MLRLENNMMMRGKVSQYWPAIRLGLVNNYPGFDVMSFCQGSALAFNNCSGRDPGRGAARGLYAMLLEVEFKIYIHKSTMSSATGT